jgi:phenol 2-monooxygenase (NADPH)
MRTGRVRDVEEGLSEFPHVIVNQARMLAYLRDHMDRSPARLAPFYGLRVSDVEVEPGASSEHPVAVTLSDRSGELSTIRAKYVVGCDGARSRIRAAIGRELVGDATDESWGVMDVLAVTDFPDIRVKAAISASQGNILIIPREGGYLVRLYIELNDASETDRLDNGVSPRRC